MYNIKEISGIDNILGSGIFAATRGSFTYLQASYLRPTTPLSQGIYLGQASTAPSGIEMVASGETTIDFSTLGTNYKGRIQYNSTTNAFSFFFTNSSATASLVLTDSTTAYRFICNNFEPTTMNTDMIIKSKHRFIRIYPYTYNIICIIIQFLLRRCFYQYLRATNGFVSG
ncbi:MAG: hypothetical protein ACKPKO_25560, partial [Candidatus Fonsibacter sp.]